MKGLRKIISLTAAVAMALPLFTFVGCGGRGETDYEFAATDYTDKSATELEALADYSVFYQPEDGRVGDVMPYYEDGVYHIFYLKDGGGSSSHPVYRVDTTDFIHYEEKGLALDAGGSNSGEAMIGTGTVLKKGGDYYFFYTGHPSTGAETVRVAKSTGSLDRFEKIGGFCISPEDYGFENDFRDPEVVWDEENGRFECIVATRKSGRAVLARFYLDAALSVMGAPEIVYTDPHGFNMLECPDLFEWNGRYYLTYSAQDLSLGGDTAGTANNTLALTGGKGCMYYLSSDDRNGPWREIGNPQIDGSVFYAGKTAFGSEAMLIGWSAQKGVNPGYDYEWGGNLVAHKLVQNADGTLSVTYPQSLASRFDVVQPLLTEENALLLISSGGTLNPLASERLSYRLSMKVKFTSDTQSFGLAFGLKDDIDHIVRVTVNPSAGKIKAQYGSNGEMAAGYVSLEADREYCLDVFAEGSNYVLYLDGVSFTFRVRNAGNKKVAAFANDGMVTFSEIAMLAPSEADADETGACSLEAGESKEVSVAAVRDCYAGASALAYASGAVRIETLDADGKAVAQTEGSGCLYLYGYTGTEAGETFTVRITARERATVLYAIDGAQTHYVPKRTVVTRAAENRGAQIVVAEEGCHSFDVVAKLADESVSGRLILTVKGEEVAFAVVKDGFARLSGAVNLSSGDAVTASVSFGDRISQYEVLSAVGTGAACESGLTPADTREREYDARANFPNVQFEERETDGGSVSESFGAQGAGGFVYTYGKAIDEMKSISVFNVNSDETYNYKYIEPSASSDIEVKADFVKTGDRYMVGATYLAAKGGELKVTLAVANVKATGGFALIQIYRNRERVSEAIVAENSERREITATLAVEAGDAISFGFKNVGYMTDLGTAEANYAFSVGAPRPDSFDEMTKIADFNADFYTDAAQANAWKYGYASNFFADESKLQFTQATVFNGETGAWGADGVSGIEIKRDWICTENYSDNADVALGYAFGAGGSYAIEVAFEGENDAETRLAARLVIADASGNVKSAIFIGDGKENVDWRYENFDVRVDAGDVAYLVFFREGVGYHKGSVVFNVYE